VQYLVGGYQTAVPKVLKCWDAPIAEYRQRRGRGDLSTPRFGALHKKTLN